MLIAHKHTIEGTTDDCSPLNNNFFTANSVNSAN